MKKLPLFHKPLLLTSALLCLSMTALADPAPATYSVKPAFGEYQDWSLLAVSHRLDKKTLRAILGNDAAIAAARHGHTKPWPDGAVMAKVVWKESVHPNWAQAIVPGAFEKAEAMIKDSKKYASTGGWGFGFWEGKKLSMYDEAKSKECFACHTVATKDNDYVFTNSALQ